MDWESLKIRPILRSFQFIEQHECVQLLVTNAFARFKPPKRYIWTNIEGWGWFLPRTVTYRSSYFGERLGRILIIAAFFPQRWRTYKQKYHSKYTKMFIQNDSSQHKPSVVCCLKSRTDDVILIRYYYAMRLNIYRNYSFFW